jgi:hypothetical protein
LDTDLVAYARRELAAVDADLHSDGALDVLGGLTVTEASAVRGVSATMNLLGDLTAVDIDTPDLDFEPEGWTWRSTALTDLIGSLHNRVHQIQTALADPEPGAIP